MNFEKEAIDRIAAAYAPLLEAAGLGRLLESLLGEEPDGRWMDIVTETHPLWLEFLAKLRAQLVTEEFTEAGKAYSALHKAGRGDSLEAMAVFRKCIQAAPDWFMDDIHGDLSPFLPAPSGYTAEGGPVYALDDIAEKLGVPTAELRDQCEALGFPPTDPEVYRVQ